MWSRPSTDLFIYVAPSLKTATFHVAGFDLDWTLIRPIKGVFPKTEDDLTLLPNRRKILMGLIDRGFTVVIFTNQKSANETRRTFNFNRLNNFVNLIGIPLIVLMSTGDNTSSYRKPNRGMVDTLSQMITIESGFYCGDASGRPQDFSDSDKVFAQNIGWKFYLPEELFPSVERVSDGSLDTINTVELPPELSLVTFVGMQGSGKSWYYENILKPMGYIHVSQDQLKTKQKVNTTTKQLMISRNNVSVDATNPAQTRREELYQLAVQYGYTVTVLYFVRNGKEWNKLRPKPVPTIAYSVYFKNLIEPSVNNTPGRLYQIM